MGYQFIHLEAYARVAGKDKAGGHTIKTIVEEADRVEGNFPHVAEAETPIVRYGVSAQEAGQLANNWAEQSIDSSARKLRKDGLCLLAGVISYPAEYDNWEEYRDKSEQWLKNKYGDCLKSIIEHTDETNPHIHFYVVQELGKRFDLLHDGRNASAQAKSEGKLKGAQNLAYKEAMRVFQDEFSEQVAMSCGLTRIGPKKRRLSRAAWQHEKQQAQFFSNSKRQHRAARKKGFDEGKKAGYAEAIQEGVKFAEKVGSSLSSFSKSLSSSWHEPTEKAKSQIKEAERLRLEAEARIKNELEIRSKMEERTKNEIKTIRSQAQIDIDMAKRTASSFEADYKAAQKTIQDLNDELRQYRRSPGASSQYKR